MENFGNGINSSLKGDCSSVFKYSVVKEVMYFDKTVNELITGKSAVKWDDDNNRCVTLSGETVDKVSDKDLCVGEAYSLQGDWQLGMNLEEVGPGEETISTPASEGVHNFVCFGSNQSPCPTDNLYRIIGVFDHKISETQTEKRVKLIKYDYATSDLLGTDGDFEESEYLSQDDEFYPQYKGKLKYLDMYYWNVATKTNIWSESNLNKINLNTNFLTNIGKEWADKIVETTWKVGGNSWENIVEQPAKTAYQNEVVNPVPGSTSSNGETEYAAKIGLMYVSEYGLAADPSAWTTKGTYYKNWMDMGLWGWTISRNANASDVAFTVESTGDVNARYVGRNAFAVRPSFSLSSSTTYKLGQGTAADPIRIN